jgi:uncharacterized protein YndB with AHSA1/START domain
VEDAARLRGAGALTLLDERGEPVEGLVPAELVPDQKVVEVDEFETGDPALSGPMTITVTLADAEDGGTELVAVHEGLPPGVREEDNELGWTESLTRLAALVERG